MYKLDMVIGEYGHDDGIDIPEVADHVYEGIDDFWEDIFVSFGGEEDNFVLEDEKIDQN